MANSNWELGLGFEIRTILLVGRRGVGKTTVCQAVAELARRRGYRPGGVITPALYACPELVLSEAEGRSRRACPEPFDLTQDRRSRRDSHGIKVGFEAVDAGSGERWLLARTDQELGGPRVGPYSFDPAGLARALRVLEKAISAGCDLLIVDEIGPLELEQGKGFAPVLEWLPSAPMESRPTAICHLLIVVRPALLDQLLQRLRGTKCTVFNVTEENRYELPMQIVEALWGDG